MAETANQGPAQIDKEGTAERNDVCHEWAVPVSVPSNPNASNTNTIHGHTDAINQLSTCQARKKNT